MSFDWLISALPEGTAAVRDLAADQALFRQGDKAVAIFGVERGRVRLIRHTVDDRRIVLHTARPGELFAEAALFSQQHHCDAVADIASRVRIFRKPPLVAAFRADPDLSQRFMAILARQVMTLRSRLEQRAIRSARQRVLQHFALVADPERRALRVEGTLMDLAAEIGLSHEALYRTLARLEKDGAIARIGDRIILMKQAGV